jgi:hypothetical protein
VSTWRVDRDDPDLSAVMATVAANPSQACFRVVVRRAGEARLRRNRVPMTRSSPLAESLGVPVMIIARVDLDRRRELLFPVFGRYPKLQFILDHCAVLALSEHDAETGRATPEVLQEAVPYADFANVALKWRHAPTLSARGSPTRTW